MIENTTCDPNWERSKWPENWYLEGMYPPIIIMYEGKKKIFSNYMDYHKFIWKLFVGRDKKFN